jgi:hypothetical protein
MDSFTGNTPSPTRSGDGGFEFAVRHQVAQHLDGKAGIGVSLGGHITRERSREVQRLDKRLETPG